MMDDPRTKFFDAARQYDDNHSLSLNEIKIIHAVLDLAGVPRAPLPPAPSPAPGGLDEVGEDGLHLIMRFEGCARLRTDGLVEAYLCPANVWTIGWGSTGPGISKGLVWTQKQCDDRLKADLTRYADDVSRVIGKVPTTQAQFDALVSFHYNTGKIAASTLGRKHAAGDYEGAAREFKRWNKGDGRVLKGLVRRRAEEEKLYRSDWP